MIIKQQRVAKAIKEANLVSALRKVDARRSGKFKTIEGIQKIIQGAPDIAKAFFFQDTVFDDPAQSLSADGTSFNTEIWSDFRDGWNQASSAAGAFYLSNLRVANRIWELIDMVAVINGITTKNWDVLGEDNILKESKGAVRPTLTWSDLMDNQMETWEDLPTAIDNRSWKEIQVTRYKITTYGVSIDLSNSNPETAVTYIDDAIGMTPGSNDWYNTPIFSKIRPCLFKDGKVVGYLNPNNFAQFEDGTDADITSGAAGDVMIEIPKIGYRISTNDNILTVQVTDDPNKKGFSYKAHTRTTEGDRNKLYIGAFLGSNKDSKLRSISGVLPLNATDLTDFRTYAKANGTGYDLFAFYPMTLLQCLYLIMFKNLNSQVALGMGYVGDTEWLYKQKKTGATVDKGMNYGTSDHWEQMKFLGIEDFWGNLHQWIDGLVSSSDYHALVATDNFNNTGDGYIDLGQLATSRINGYVKAPQGTNDLGFIVREKGGSSSTYFSDFASFDDECATMFGGSFDDKVQAGAFRLFLFYGPANKSVNLGGRLMFL